MMDSKDRMEKFKITGLDCAQCAYDIEIALRKFDGMNGATVNFVTETMTIPENQLDKAAEVLKRVEPDAQIVIPDHYDGTATKGHTSNKNNPDDEPSSATPQIIRIGLSIILTGIGIAFNKVLHSTSYQWAEYAVLITAYLLVGTPVLISAFKNIVRGRVFDEMFLMSIATLGAIVIHQLPEAVAVMLFFSVGEFFQDLAVGRSRRSISALMDLRPDTARLVMPEGILDVNPDDVPVGSIIQVLPGERIPLDGVVVTGESAVDTSALTGESMPRSVSPGEPVFSGFVNDSGMLQIRTTKMFAESSVSRILELVENAASRKAPTERFISRFASIYTPIIVGIAAVIAFLPPLLIPGAILSDWVYRALIILVISCPCALVLSIPLGYFGGIGGASRRSILIKGANFIDALKKTKTIVMDKTGTLTKGAFSVTKIVPRNGHTADEVLRWAATAESQSTHPIARSIRKFYQGELAPGLSSILREEKGYGVIAQVYGKQVIAGSDRLFHRENIEHMDCEASGTIVYVAVDNTYIGYLLISDEIKPEASLAIARLRKSGIRRVVMLTGDNERIAREVAEEIGIKEYYAELLPEEKVSKVEELKSELSSQETLAFVGDGINDAPVLMHSDIGFAMGALGSDAAIEAADIVIMDDNVDRIPTAIEIAHFTHKIVLQNIVLALSVKTAFLALGAIGVATMWEAVIADVGVSLLAVLNATRTLRFSRGT